MAKVDAHYTSIESAQLLRVGAVEERVLSFQRQLEERYRSELNMAVSFGLQVSTLCLIISRVIS